MSRFDKLASLFRTQKPSPEIPILPPVKRGLIKTSVQYFGIVDAEYEGRGVRIVDVPRELVVRYREVLTEWVAINEQLGALPHHFRRSPRKPKAGVSRGVGESE